MRANAACVCLVSVLVLVACGGEPTPAEDGSTSELDGGVPDGGMSGACAGGSYDADGDPSTACVAWTACEAGEYVSSSGTATSDQTCAGCVSGTFSASADASECVSWTTCAAGTFVSAEGSATADRTCAECEAGTHTTAENQSMCVAGDACEPGTAEVEPATATMAAVCEACAAGEYCAGGDVPRAACDAGDGTWDHDADPSTACADRTACVAGSAVAAEGDATTDRSCEACADGSFSAEPNALSCAAWSECGAGESVSNTPSATEDRTCASCGSGEYSTTPNAASCAAWTVCAAGESVATAGAATEDRTCAACVSGSYSATANAASCAPWTDCVAGEYVSTAGSASRDRACTACAPGTFTSGSNQSMCLDVGACAPGTTQTAPGTSTSPPTCAVCAAGEYCAGDTAAALPCDDGDGTWDHDGDPATVCAARTTCSVGTYVASEGDATTDRVCSACASGEYSATTNAASCVAWSTCSAGSYVSATPSASADRVCSVCASGRYSATANAASCAAWSTCSAGSYVSAAASSTRDRTCSACIAGEFSAVANAPSCSAWRTCSPGTYISNTPSASVDRVCTGCPSGEFSTTMNAASCSVWTTCASDAYASNTPSATEDRTCAGCTPIANCASGLSCTNASDQTCGACASGYVLRAGVSVCGLAWESQFGTTAPDRAYSVAVDGSGNVYVVGATEGEIALGMGEGIGDAFVRKFSVDGTVLWTRQFGTASPDFAQGVAVDGSGNVYVTGYTFGALVGSNQGGSDAFVRKFSVDGAVLWTQQFGTGMDDYARAVAVDSSGNVHVAGDTDGALGTSQGATDAFVRKFASDGTVLWTDQFGTTVNDTARSIAVDGSGVVYIAGWTSGALGLSEGRIDAFVRKYSSGGAPLWTRQFGTASDDYAQTVTVDASGGVYVGGATGGGLEGAAAGNGDGFLRKFSSAGTVLWTRQFGTTQFDTATSVAASGTGEVYVAGHTYGALGGPHVFLLDLFVFSYTTGGALVWTNQRGSTGEDLGLSVAADGNGAALVAGHTSETWPGQSRSGREDALLARFGP